MKEDIPPLLEKAHQRNVESRAKEGGGGTFVDGEVGISSILSEANKVK